MSYDFYIAVDTGGDEPHYIEPYFCDVHPRIGRDSGGMTAILTDQGYARCGNYTGNVSGMWSRCLTAAARPGEMRWVGDDARARLRKHPGLTRYQELFERQQDLTLRDLADKTGETLIPLLRRAVEWGVAHLTELHESDPVSGWGNADGAVTYLWDIQRMCERHPSGRLCISS